MDTQALTQFFMWCSVINVSLLIVWSLAFLMAPDLVFRMQTWFIPIPRETFNVLIYAFLGLFKIAFLVFSFVPYVALLLIGE